MTTSKRTQQSKRLDIRDHRRLSHGPRKGAKCEQCRGVVPNHARSCPAYCPSGKYRFETKSDADAALLEAKIARVFRRARTKRKEERTYRHPVEQGGCGGWHLTSRKNPPMSVTVECQASDTSEEITHHGQTPQTTDAR